MSSMETSSPGGWVIRGGRVVDPAQDLDELSDVLLCDGRVQAVGKQEAVPSGWEEFDARGCLVTPGLLDAHAHVYEHCTPLGVNPDAHCLSRGVTTVVDAGSAGAGTFAGLRHFIARPSATRVQAFLHIAAHGLAAAGCSGFGAGGECDSLNQVDPALCLQCIRDPANEPIICGVKVRLTADVANNGEYEEEVFRRALQAARSANLPLMVHHAFSTIPTQADINTQEGPSLSCPGSLQSGDIYTHTFHGYPSTILDPASQTVLPDVIEAQNRGVWFDVGHGQGSFSWSVAEHCAKQGFWPDIISTDLHSGNFDGPVYDLVTVMTKVLHIGMPLPDVIKAVTSTPARAIHKDHLIGSLQKGRVADVTVMRLNDCDVNLEDSQGQCRRIKSRLVPIAVWKEGKKFDITTSTSNFPNDDKWAALAKPWDKLLIRDAKPPPK